MCGIAGCLNLREAPPPGEELLRAMLGQIRHRGPDEFGIYLGDQVGLGNARLCIVDLAGGQQPISNETGDVWIVYNGEIFNYPELRQDLETRGHRFSTHTDTEVIVHLYEEFGTACLAKLNGQFAFAIWDARRRSLFIARDRLGVRPLFYTVVDDSLIFGSEIKVLFADSRVTRALAPRGIAQVFSYWSTLSPVTCFEGIQELPPGHFLIIEGGKMALTRYWSLEFQSEKTALPSTKISTARRTVASLADEFAELLVDATRIRLRADVPVGAYLSGGLDSSVIAAIIRRIGTSRLDTFSIAFSDPEFDESQPQQRMASLLGTDHQVVRAADADIARVFPDIVWHTETALTRTAPAPMFLLSQLVRSRNYKVVLTGEGADEFLAGYDIFKEAKIRRFWAREPDSKRRPQLLRRLYPEIVRLGASAPAFLKAFFGNGLGDTGASDYSHHIRWRNNQRTHRFFSEGFTGHLGEAHARAKSEIVFPARFADWDHLQQAQYIEASTFLPGYLLSSQGDRVAMAHAVEGRYPFLDVRVVEFCASLPPGVKMPALRDKTLLRVAAQRWLPPEITRRRKQPYRAPIHRCFGAADAPGYIAELFSDSALRNSGIFNPISAGRLYQAVRQGRALGETDEMALIGILSTQLLHQLFVKERSVRPKLNAIDRIKIVDERGRIKK
ncbi:MAG TPA: asparagine synthase (glutamine-hydrolyzing) [Lacunisphaera sp.]|jgi:asparagine synthase (glutamine-hydrolysing)